MKVTHKNHHRSSHYAAAASAFQRAKLSLQTGDQASWIHHKYLWSITAKRRTGIFTGRRFTHKTCRRHWNGFFFGWSGNSK